MAALFDTIHDDALSKRAEPATLAEFVGLSQILCKHRRAV